MANTTPQKLSIHTQLFLELVPGHEPNPVDIIATSVEELFDTVARLTAGNGAAGAPVASPAPEAAPAPVTPAATTPEPAPSPKPEPTPTPTPSAPTAPSAASPTEPSPTPAPVEASTSAPAPATSLTLEQVLTPARQLLNQPGGEDRLRAVLASCGESAISTAKPENYPAIIQGVNAALGL